MILGDAKMCAPLTIKLKHWTELQPHPDSEVLPQGSFFEDRVFIKRKPERKILHGIVEDPSTVGSIITSNQFKTENGKMMKKLLQFIYEKHGTIPKNYIKFIRDLSTSTGIDGYLQVTGNHGLELLKRVAQKSLDLRSSTNLKEIQLFRKEIPALYDALTQILKIENCQYLPNIVCSILFKIIKMRKDLVERAPERKSSDYIA